MTDEIPSGDSSTITTEEQFVDLLLKEFEPRTVSDFLALKRAVRLLAKQALHDPAINSGNAVATINAIIAKMDARIVQQLALIAQQGQRQ